MKGASSRGLSLYNERMIPNPIASTFFLSSSLTPHEDDTHLLESVNEAQSNSLLHPPPYSCSTPRAPQAPDALSDGSDDESTSRDSPRVRTVQGSHPQLSLYAWGSNNAHQLPITSREQALSTPTKSAFFSASVRPLLVAAGGSHAFCLTEEGGLLAWGAGARGQLGLGAAVSQSDVPRAVV